MPVMSADALRALALGLPGAVERETWGHPTFRVGDKIFASVYEGDAGAVATVKATPEDQAELLAADPATFGVASHVGRYGWTTVRLDRVDPEEMRELVVEAWRQTAPKRAVAAFDRGRPSRRPPPPSPRDKDTSPVPIAPDRGHVHL